MRKVSSLVIHSDHTFKSEYYLNTTTIKGLGAFEPAQFYFEINGPDAPTAPPNGNGIMAATLPLAMSRGLDIRCQAAADEDFLARLEECMAAWCRLRPDLFKPIALSCDREIPQHLPQTTSAIMAFSGGLDSAFALYAHNHAMLGRRTLKIPAAVLVHGFDIPLDETSAFAAARKHSKAILDSFGVRLNTVRTNWKDPFCVKWGMTHILGLSAILHLFHHKFAAGVFADDFSYDAQWMPWSNNAVTNQLLGSTSFAIRSTGACWSRTEKAGFLVGSPLILQHLRICYEHPELGSNCGRCEKCVRTKINFYANGVTSLPVLGAPLTKADLAVLQALTPESILWYRDALAKGTWPRRDPIRGRLQEIVAAYDAHFQQTPSGLGVRTPTTLRRIKTWLKPARRGVRNILGGRRR